MEDGYFIDLNVVIQKDLFDSYDLKIDRDLSHHSKIKDYKFL
jgi:hypothetical protein